MLQRTGTAPGLPAMLVCKHEINIGGHIQFTGPQLAHADHDHAHGLSIGPRRSAPLTAGILPEPVQRHVQRLLRQAGHVRYGFFERRVEYQIPVNDMPHCLLTVVTQRLLQGLLVREVGRQTHRCAMILSGIPGGVKGTGLNVAHHPIRPAQGDAIEKIRDGEGGNQPFPNGGCQGDGIR
ncbi:hypothetical protein AAIA72_15330 [Hahella sp. SMD15-11]|uniref:Uncharacterized protein n=1 Tax=Thermohahella caldifontis TaxID=3142973 RepID=A0AB39UVX0_9GAMM